MWRNILVIVVVYRLLVTSRVCGNQRKVDIFFDLIYTDSMRYQRKYNMFITTIEKEWCDLIGSRIMVRNQWCFFMSIWNTSKKTGSGLMKLFIMVSALPLPKEYFTHLTVQFTKDFWLTSTFSSQRVNMTHYTPPEHIEYSDFMSTARKLKETNLDAAYDIFCLQSSDTTIEYMKMLDNKFARSAFEKGYQISLETFKHTIRNISKWLKLSLIKD